MVEECFIIPHYGEMWIFVHTHTLQENDVWKPGPDKNFSVEVCGVGGRRREGVRTLQHSKEFECNLDLAEETLRWRRYCSIQSMQIKSTVLEDSSN